MSFQEVYKVSKLILLRKQRSEFLFKKNYLLWKGSKNSILISSIESELLNLEKEIKQIEKIYGQIKLVFPDDKKIKELDDKLSTFKESDIFLAMEEKKGEIYELLMQKSGIMKKIYENLNDVVRINLEIIKLNENDKKNVCELL